MTKGYIDYNNEEVSIYERPREERELNVVANIKTRDERYAALPRMNEEPVCVATLERHVANTMAAMSNPEEMVMRSESGRAFVLTVDDSGNLKSTGMSMTTEELQDAIKAGGNVCMYADMVGSGIVIPEGTELVLDMKGHSYTIVDPTVGSAGTETLGFQLLKDSNITIKNGAILAGTDSVKMLIQNYSNLTLEDMFLSCTGSKNCQYVLSNNNGNTVIKGDTDIIAPEGACAVDAYYWSKHYPSVHVTIDTKGEIVGRLEYTNDGLKSEEEIKANSSLEIVQGTFTEDPSAYVLGSSQVIMNDAGGYEVSKN